MTTGSPLFSHDSRGILDAKAGKLLDIVHEFTSSGIEGSDKENLFALFRTMALAMSTEIMESGHEDGELSGRKDRVKLSSVLTILDVLRALDEEALLQDADLLTLYAIMSYCAENYPPIPEYCQHLLTAEPTEGSRGFRKYLDAFLYRANENLALPRFRMDYSERVEKGWEVLVSKLEEVSKQRRKSEKESVCLEASLHFAAYTGLPTTIDPPSKREDKFTLSLDTVDMEADFYPMLYVWDHLPQSLSGKTTFPGTSPIAPAKEWRDTLKGNPEFRDARFAIRDSEDHRGVTIEAYGAQLQALDAKSAARTKATLDSLLLDLLGRYTWYLSIRSVSIPEDGTAPADAISLMQLPQALQDLGYSLNATRHDLEPKLHRTYTGTPSDSTALREDILTGETYCYKLLEEYRNGQTNTADHLITIGVAPVFLAWPKSIISGDEKDFCDRFLAYLLDYDEIPMCKVIGTASGSRYFYLDLLVWSLEILTEDVENYFAKIPGGDQVVLQCLRAGSKPGPATVQRLHAYTETKVETKVERAEPPKPQKSGPQSSAKNAKNKKGKNKKKRKK